MSSQFIDPFGLPEPLDPPKPMSTEYVVDPEGLNIMLSDVVDTTEEVTLAKLRRAIWQHLMDNGHITKRES